MRGTADDWDAEQGSPNRAATAPSPDAIPRSALDTPPTAEPPQQLGYTPFHAIHVELGAKMVPFAGYHMPV